ncbi:MAG: deoxyribodipyrimidine photo-lyase [Pegethrix bostrychoides GSE-TBD4-15B]|jgi:deoxyribodipyrimidine photo-lyase|uniref:Deoxyribodipyrimidine photo-lyase n=1 Tax=Pegethrix bostrychoides GSE-TBD4-15B TaxID=2839662 RepID=A0A951U3A2_9CYAN|nr:deoxyribodipyrimidine photo-lyase [Pegethrix bostrychoides GSE-TBD4-15B]
MSDLILFWHRRDLRLVDNLGLVAARQRSAKLVGLFCLDPEILQNGDVAPARVVYLMGSLQALQQDYAKAGSQLLILQGQPAQALPALATALSCPAVYWNRDVEPYGRSRDRAVAAALREVGVEVQADWDQLLHPPQQVMTGAGQPYTVYTPFWRNWQSQPKAEPVTIGEPSGLSGLNGLSESEQSAAEKAGVTPLPSANDLGFVWENALLLAPGNAAAQAQLDAFCDQAIQTYDEQRNFPAAPGTSILSAALKFGTVGIRTVWAASEQAKANSRSDETRQNIQTWQQELAWREFYQHCMYFFPKLAEGAYRKQLQNFPWEGSSEQFEAWCEGRTGYPIVDAAMRQLNGVGWMHNRCRMIVASFLTKDLIINWQDGERYFMQKLYDGDLSANNGGWQWSASSGMDPKPLRIFNPASQAQKFDPEADYIREWLPELRSLETADLVSGKISKSDCQRCGYPMPIVEHKVQQARFKQLYQQQKAG